MKIEGAVVVVAGGSAGIGLGCAKAFAAAGAKTVILLARRQERLDEAAKGIPGAVGIAVDLTNEAETQRVAREIEAKHGVPHIVCHTAGAGSLHAIQEETFANFRTHFESTNYTLFNLVKAFLDGMVRENRGHIVVGGGSLITHIPYAATGYIASRAALHGMANALREDLHDTNVRVTYCECGGIGAGTAYFTDNPGSKERLPFSRFPRLGALFYASADTEGRRIVKAVRRNRAVYYALAPRGFIWWAQTPILGRLVKYVIRATGVPPARGGFLSGYRGKTSANSESISA